MFIKKCSCNTNIQFELERIHRLNTEHKQLENAHLINIYIYVHEEIKFIIITNTNVEMFSIRFSELMQRKLFQLN